ncbi:Ku protein [Streptomyces sp. NPDC006610]|uniref:Ku protein n=1 Tax=Streptomyces sp. NPDC006610 TaxID=3154584 RepID=UPI0033AA257D
MASGAAAFRPVTPTATGTPLREGTGPRPQPDRRGLPPPALQVAAKPYKLLVQALGRSSKAAVAKYAWSGRERLGLLRVRGDVLVLHSMRWPTRSASSTSPGDTPNEFLPPPVDVPDEEIDGAFALMDTMTVEDLEHLGRRPGAPCSAAGERRPQLADEVRTPVGGRGGRGGRDDRSPRSAGRTRDGQG